MRAARVRRAVAGIAICIGAATRAGAQPPANPVDVIVRGELGARVDSFLTRAAMFGLSGSIVVARKGEVILQKGYGLADRERAAAIGPDTPFFICSLAKPFTAT